jgi:hypothetical protein
MLEEIKHISHKGFHNYRRCNYLVINAICQTLCPLRVQYIVICMGDYTRFWVGEWISWPLIHTTRKYK